MKKGTIGSLLGVMFFFGIGSFIFTNNSSVFKSIPSFVFIILIGGVFSMFKKYSKTVKGKSQNYKSTFSDKKEETDDSKFIDTYKSEDRGHSKRCHKCSSLISSGDDYCPECGASQKNTIICEYCGHENPSTNALCEECNGFL